MVKYLVEAKLYLAVKLQSELIIRVILQAVSILRKKLKLRFYATDGDVPMVLFGFFAPVHVDG